MSVNGYLQVQVMNGVLFVNVWSDKDCVGDLLTQANFRIDRISGLSVRERGAHRAHWEDQTVLAVHLAGHAATFEGQPVDGFYDDINDAMDALRPITEEVNA